MHASSSSLPLLSNTLLLVRATSDAKRLTLAGYRQMGGLASAIETLAEEINTGPGSSWTIDPRGGQLYAVSLTRHGARALLAAGGRDGFAALWDVTDSPRQLAALSGWTGSDNITALSSPRIHPYWPPVTRPQASTCGPGRVEDPP